MLKRFTLGTAGIAIAVSLMGTAHAQDADEVFGPSLTDETELAGTNAADEYDNASDASDGDRVIIRLEAPESETYPMELIGLGAELTSLTAPVALSQRPVEPTLTLTRPQNVIAPISTGIVTPQSVDPFYGDIDPFYGDINPFYGDIDAFWGNINPFYGDIDAFWGDINPFYGDINPFYGDIDAFWGDIDAFYGDIDAFSAEDLAQMGDFWKANSEKVAAVEANWSSLTYAHSLTGDVLITFDGAPNRIRDSIEALIAQGEAQFGAAYQAKTGKTFREGFVSEILDRHGLDLSNTATAKKTLAKTASERAWFYLDWHDSLNLYTGVDQVDHWMATINWNPKITQIQGDGKDTIIGIIDGSFAADADLGDNVIWSGGYDNHVGGHGVGVASLIAGAHDGEGVMGIAPDVMIATYNPFNPNGGSGWDEVADAIIALQKVKVKRLKGSNQASIINMSLGEKGWTLSQGMADVLQRKEITKYHKDTIFVIAAGNDGVVQHTDIDWDFNNDPAMIMVGSINPLGEISSFSNQAGTTCLLDNGVCHAGNELFRRMVVAPGEMIAMSDGNGGVTRHSGTSFAAPLVSGAISLLHDRWTWLYKHPEETADIIFRSARDLGAPGVDPIYGWGLLDVAASQSPLDFNSMTFHSHQRSNANGNVNGWLKKTVSATELLGGIPTWWETEDVYFTMFEDIGDTYRDFTVPVSAFQYGKTTNVLGRNERMQDFISRRFANWIHSGGTDANGDGLPGFSEVRSTGNEIRGDWSLRYDAIMPTVSQDGTWRPMHGAATLTNPHGTMSFTVGHGQGAMALGGYRFGMVSDFDPFTGGVNPVLGFASGETFASAQYNVAKGTSVKVGFSQNREEWDEFAFAGADPREISARQALGARPATAVTFDVEQKVSDRVSVGVNFTRLRETNALLGTQTSVNALLGNGSRTEAMTVSASVDVGSGITFDLSATGARTETASGQLFANNGDIMSTAGQFTATKRGVLSGNDTLRVSVAQPLQIERGDLQFTAEEVIDRETGEIGLVTQTFGIETRRRITGEAVYAMPLSNSAEFGLFGRYVSAGEIGDEESYVVGGNYTLRF